MPVAPPSGRVCRTRGPALPPRPVPKSSAVCASQDSFGLRVPDFEAIPVLRARRKSSRWLAEQSLLARIILAAIDRELLSIRKDNLLEPQDMRAILREIAAHRDLIPRLHRIFGPASARQAQGADRLHEVLLRFSRLVVYFNLNDGVRIYPLDVCYGPLQGRCF